MHSRADVASKVEDFTKTLHIRSTLGLTASHEDPTSSDGNNPAITSLFPWLTIASVLMTLLSLCLNVKVLFGSAQLFFGAELAVGSAILFFCLMAMESWMLIIMSAFMLVSAGTKRWESIKEGANRLKGCSAMQLITVGNPGNLLRGYARAKALHQAGFKRWGTYLDSALVCLLLPLLEVIGAMSLLDKIRTLSLPRLDDEWAAQDFSREHWLAIAVLSNQVVCLCSSDGLSSKAILNAVFGQGDAFVGWNEGDLADRCIT